MYDLHGKEGLKDRMGESLFRVCVSFLASLPCVSCLSILQEIMNTTHTH